MSFVTLANTQFVVHVTPGEQVNMCYLLSGSTQLTLDLGSHAHAQVVCYIDSSDVLIGEHTISMQLAQSAACHVTILHVQNTISQLKIMTRQHHVGSYGQSSVLVKGVLRDTARAWYRGTIRIEQDTAGNSAEQYSKTLLLSDQAFMHAMPALEVLAHDVQCKHGSAIGVTNEEQLMYLRAHGISAKNAEQILVDGFCADIFMLLPEELKKKYIVV